MSQRIRNPIVTRELKNVVKDGMGRTAVDLVNALPSYTKCHVKTGEEKSFLEKFSSVVREVDGYWYKRGEEPTYVMGRN